ncbi:hypothetical protein C0J52_22805, partial [Blattella germanica]
MERWAGRVAVVTGTSSGIGAAIAKELALSKSLKSEKGELHPLKCDITKDDEIKKAFAWVKSNLGGVDILVNNAAVAIDAPLIGNAGWGSEEILSYFKKWENNQDFNIYKNKKYHSTEGLQSVGRFPYVDENAETLLKAFNASGYRNTDFNGANPTGYSLMQYFQKDGERQSSSRAFISPIRKTRSNLKIVTNVRVTKIIINAKSKEAEGIEYVWENNRNQKGKLFARKEVILSTGPMSSPQLLMLSGIGPKEVLEKYQIKVIENLQVGGNLQNHIQSGSIDLVLNSRKTTL